MNEPLFSVIILCYRRFEYLYSAIDSLLRQDYPNIEIVVSDDGSEVFPKEQIEAYIRQYKGPNIARTVVRQQSQNSGTVRHLNDAVQACTGAYIALLPADDNFYDEHVLTSYAEGFAQAPENCYIEMAQTGMYDENLETLDEYYLKPWVQAAMEQTETDSSALYAYMIRLGACLPSPSTCFKREFFDKFGKFDEDYALVEDYPAHVRLAKEGWVLHYANFVAIKHRHGGISHGQSGTLSRSKKLYAEDSIRMIDEIMLKNLDALPPEDRALTARRRERERDWIAFTMARLEGNRRRMAALALRHPAYSLTTVLNLLGGRLRPAWRPVSLAAAFLWLFSDTVARMFETLTGWPAVYLSNVLLVLTVCASILWVCCAVILLLQRLVGHVQRFPTETLRVG